MSSSDGLVADEKRDLFVEYVLPIINITIAEDHLVAKRIWELHIKNSKRRSESSAQFNSSLEMEDSSSSITILQM